MTNVHKMFNMPDHNVKAIRVEDLPDVLVDKLTELDKTVSTCFKDCFIDLMVYNMQAVANAASEDKPEAMLKALEVLGVNVAMSYFAINIPRSISKAIGLIIATNKVVIGDALTDEHVKMLIAASLHSFEEGLYAGLATKK